MKLKNIFILSSALLTFSSCDDLFEPAVENHKDLSSIEHDAKGARGLMADAYLLLPYPSTSNTDVATDDAVTNDNTNSYLQIASQNTWSSSNDPLSQWRDRYGAIQFCNLLLEHVDQVEWAYSSPTLNHMYRDQYKGQAFAMRGLQFFYLLRAHAGVGTSGELLGAPIHIASEDGGSDFNQPRAPFKECIDQIIADLDSADVYLPLEYGNVGENSPVLAKYPGGNNGEWNKAMGDHQRGKIDRKIVAAIRAQVALFAASPAYAQANAMSWKDAAEAAAAVIKDRKMQPEGWYWFNNNDEMKVLSTGENPLEIIWRDNLGEDHSRESDNFPPALNGNGRINPSQNLVDAFPMANGYPINHAKSGYDAKRPYENRDPRLNAYIVVNGSTIGAGDDVIVTGTYVPDNSNGVDFERGRSTRTGYYLRKTLNNQVGLTSGKETDAFHYTTRIRATEIFLAYAEAANEADGPDAKFGGCLLSAKDVIKALRDRAGVGTAYVDECTTKEQMRELIRNERRIELCFENQRFYDLRRWNLPLTDAVKGIKITAANADGTLVYTTDVVENRTYESYMNYGPIPYSEIMKFSNLEQNQGWR